MRDPEVERKLRLLELQVENWKKLHDLITYGLDKAKPIISSEQERQFTELRAYLLQETEHILRELGVLAELSGKTMNVLQRGVSIRAVRELPNDHADAVCDRLNVRGLFGMQHGALEVVEDRKQIA